MNLKRILFVVVLIVTSFCYSFSQQLELQPTEQKAIKEESSYISLHLVPGLPIPLGDDMEFYTLGLNSDFSVEFKLPPFPLLYFNAFGGYTFSPLEEVSFTPLEGESYALNMISAGGGAGIDWNIVKGLHIGLFTRGGFAFGFIPDKDNTIPEEFETTGFTGFIDAGVFAGYQILPTLRLGAAASYRKYFGELYNCFMISMDLAITILTKKERMREFKQTFPPLDLLSVSNIRFEPVFPVFFKHYDDHPIGKVLIENKGNKPIEDVQVSFFVKEYMDNPKVCSIIEELNPGEIKEVDIYSLFTKTILTISESTKVSANIVIESKYDGKNFNNEYVQTLNIYDRNAITWEDDRRAAAFVTMKDPTVLKFSKFVSNQIKDKVSNAINQQFLKALGMVEALKLYDISYVVDPSTPYKKMSQEKLTVDYLQYPMQTLEYKAGDCDDLSILYCALLESIGVKTAFVTVPGHIYAAVSLDIKPKEAQKYFLDHEEFIFTEDDTWLPIEVTLFNEGFLKAWRHGARQWREYSPAGKAGFFPIHDAWELYKPIGFSSEAEAIDLPSGNDVVNQYITEVNRFVEKEIFTRVTAYKDKIKQAQGNSRIRNKLGVLYARYGKNKEAKEQFQLILKKEEYIPALINIGNLYYLEFNHEQALEYYERAYERAKDNKIIILCLARAHHELENYSYVKKYFNQLKEKDPALAERYSYLELKGEELSRAADVDQLKGGVIWEE